jgi:hypothetical protein
MLLRLAISLSGIRKNKYHVRLRYMDKNVNDQRAEHKIRNVSSKMLLMRPETGNIISTRGRMYRCLMESRIERKKNEDGDAAGRGETTCSKS